MQRIQCSFECMLVLLGEGGRILDKCLPFGVISQLAIHVVDRLSSPFTLSGATQRIIGY